MQNTPLQRHLTRCRQLLLLVGYPLKLIKDVGGIRLGCDMDFKIECLAPLPGAKIYYSWSVLRIIYPARI